MVDYLYNKFPVMDKLKYGRIFNLCMNHEGKVTITEGCDDHFTVSITKEEAKEISKFFSELSKMMH